MNKSPGVEFDAYGIGQLLSESRFTVPPHQRSYKWEREDHVRRLFDDINEAISDPKVDSYFLGMLVLMHGDHLVDDQLEVIDGQQRLATVSIFLAAVRDHFREQGDDRWEDLQSKYISERDLRTREPDPHLILNVEDRAFFESHVVVGNGRPIKFKRNEKPPISNRRIADAIDEAKQQVKRIVDHGSSATASDRLLNWVDFIRHKLLVIGIKVDAEQNAYTLFETLNDRGLELTKADLIKNHLFSRAQNKLDEVRHRWTEMTATLEAAGDEDVTVEYIRHYWMSKYQAVRKKMLYKHVKEKTHAKQEACETAANLSNDAKMYAALLNPEAELWKTYGDTTKDHITSLRRMGIEVIRPLALAVLRKFDIKQTRLAFHLFVNWSVRFLIVGGHRGEGLETKYSERAIGIDKEQIRTAAQLSRKMADVVPANETFKAAFAVAHVSKQVLARYYLRAIEDQIAGEDHPEKIIDPKNDVLTLEHIIPQHPAKGWKLAPEEAEGLFNRLGNLALLPKGVNENIGNSRFSDKKSAFAGSGLKYTEWVARQAIWGAGEIDKRQKKLAEEAVKTWPLKVW